MPFGGLLTAGIGAGSSVLSGVFGSKAAKKAAQAADAKSQLAISAQQGEHEAGVNDINDAEGRSNQAIKDARDEGQGFVQRATQQGQDQVGSGVSDANALLSPYSDVGATSIASLKDLSGANGPLTNKFSFNPSDLQKDPGYAFTLQQGQDALQRSAAARGQLYSSGTLKSLAGYTTGTANQYFNDAFNRSKTTFDTNQNQALSRISTLQGLAGLGYGASTKQADNTLGGSEFGATLGEAGSQFRSNVGTNAASQISGNNMQGTSLRTTLGTNTTNNISNLLTGQGLANANAVAGSTNSWLGALNNGTNATLNYLAGKTSTPKGAPGYNPANQNFNLNSYDEFS